MDKVHEPKAAGWNDLNSEWVEFPGGKAYLLPIVVRDQKFVPVFNDDGTVTLETQCKPDSQLEAVLNAFLDIMGDFDKSQPWMWTDAMCGQFFGVVRTLLGQNYAFTNDELSKLLTVSSAQLEILFNAIFKHILRK